MIKYSLYITEEQEQELRDLAKNGVSVSELIRRSINNYLKEEAESRVSISPSK